MRLAQLAHAQKENVETKTTSSNRSNQTDPSVLPPTFHSLVIAFMQSRLTVLREQSVFSRQQTQNYGEIPRKGSQLQSVAKHAFS